MKVLLCAIGKYENRYVREWVEHYQKIKDVHVFSMADSALQSGIGKILEELYPEKSRWEK